MRYLFYPQVGNFTLALLGSFNLALTCGPAAAGQLLEGAVVKVFKQPGDTLVHLGQGEAAVVAQPGQDPALHYQHGHLGLGFIARPVGAGRQDGDLIVLGPLLVAGIEVRIVATGRADAAAQVIGDDQGGATAEEGQGPAMAAQPVGE